MKPLLAALILGEKNENLSPSADVLRSTSNSAIFKSGNGECEMGNLQNGESLKAGIFKMRNL